MNDNRTFIGRRPSNTGYALHSESLTSRTNLPTSPTTASNPAWPRHESPPPQEAGSSRQQGRSDNSQAANVRRAQQTEAAAAAERKFRCDLRRGLGPENSFNVTADGAIMVPEPAAVPYASSSSEERRPRIARSVSNGFKALGRAFSSRARADTSISRTNIRLVSGIMHDNINGGPEVNAEGFEIVHRAIPIEQAQRQREAEKAAGTRSARFNSELAVAARAERNKVRALTNDRTPPTRPKVMQVRSGQPVLRSPAVVQPAQSARPEASPAPRPIKTVGHPDRCTTFGDFIDIPSSDSGSARASKKPEGGDVSRPTTPYRRPRFVAMPPPPVPVTTAAAAKRKPVKRSKPVEEPQAESSSAAQRRQAQLPRDSAYALTSEQQKLLERGYVGKRCGHERKCKCQNDTFEEQLRAQGVDVDRYTRAVDQAKMRFGNDADDEIESEPVVDNFPHDKHTSWVVTQASQPGRIDAYHVRLANDGMVSADPRQGREGEYESTADLWARIEAEKAGKAKPTLGRM